MAFVFSEQGDISVIHYGPFYAKFSLEQNSSGNILEQLSCFFLPRSKLSKLLFTSTLLLFNYHLKENLLKDFFATIMYQCAAEISSQTGPLDILGNLMPECERPTLDTVSHRLANVADSTRRKF